MHLLGGGLAVAHLIEQMLVMILGIGKSLRALMKLLLSLMLVGVISKPVNMKVS